MSKQIPIREFSLKMYKVQDLENASKEIIKVLNWTDPDSEDSPPDQIRTEIYSDGTLIQRCIDKYCREDAEESGTPLRWKGHTRYLISQELQDYLDTGVKVFSIKEPHYTRIAFCVEEKGELHMCKNPD